MKRADWLNLIQATLVGLQSFNLYLVHSANINPMFVHLMGINTPTQSEQSNSGGTK